MTYFLLITGLILLVTGGDLLVRGAVALAEKLGVSCMLIGLTVVGFGTSLPEFVISIQAAAQGADGMVIGNVMGSNIANVLLILGVSALIYPLDVDKNGFKANAVALSLSTIVCVALCFTGSISRLSGVVLITLLLGYLGLVIRAESRRPQQCTLLVEASNPLLPINNPSALVVGEIPSSTTKAIVLLILGLVIMLLGAHFLVDSAIHLARELEVSEATIGATVVALGTSLPELVTCMVAAWKQQADIAFGNIIGSNIYNVFGILGVSAVIYPLNLPREVAGLDSWFLIGSTIALLMMVGIGYRITRMNGAFLFVGYLSFICLAAIRS